MADTQCGNKYNHARNEGGPLLHGERITLRRPRLQDATHVFNWERDDEVWRYDPRRPYSRTMAEFLPLFERGYIRGNGRQYWFIIEDEHHTALGTITYFNLDRRMGQVEVGLGLGEKSRWGQGYGPEAIRTLVQYLFTLPGITRVYAETALANYPARRAFAKAGFRETGHIFDPRSSPEPWVMLEILKPNITEAPS
jgi:[ribosomal protein S5]-alanine N-acetyltransferase